MAVKLGTLLVREGVISPQQLEEALRIQVIYGGRLGTNLVELNFVDLDTMGEWLGRVTGFPVATQAACDAVAPEVVALIPPDMAERFECFPLRKDGRRLHLAMVNPSDLAATDALSFKTGLRIVPFVIPELRLYSYLEKKYGLVRKLRYVRLAGNASAPPPKSVPPPPAAGGAADAFTTGMPHVRAASAPASAPPLPGLPAPPAAPVAAPVSVAPVAVPPPLPPLPAASPGAIAWANPFAPPAPAPAPQAPSAPPAMPANPWGASQPPPPRPAASSWPTAPAPPAPPAPASQPPRPPAAAPVVTRPEVRPVQVPPAPVAAPPTSSRPDVRPVAAAPAFTPAGVAPVSPSLRPTAASDVETAPALTPVRAPAPTPPPPAPVPVPSLSLDGAIAALEAAQGRDEIADVVLRFGTGLLDGVMIFLVRDGMALGWMGGGKGIDPSIVELIMLPLNAPSIFQEATESRRAFHGPVPDVILHKHFYKALRRETPAAAVVVPVVMRDRAVNLIYGDRFDAGDASERAEAAAGALGELAVHIATAYERIVRDAKRRLG